MRRQQPVKVAIYYPRTMDSQLELSKRVAAVHADAVLSRLKALRCPEAQKLVLLEAVIATIREKDLHKISNPESAHTP